jgi:tetratricopeptide (TPR) repeat protein
MVFEVYKSWTTFHQLGVARSMVMNKANTLDLNKLYCYVNDNKVILFDGWKQRYLGEILFHIGDQYISEAEKWIRKAINSDGKYGMIFNLARDYKILAALLEEKGDKQQAKENLNKAINIFKKFGADGWVERTKRERASCLSK